VRRWVRGAKPRVVNRGGSSGGDLISPVSRLISVGIAALAIVFAVGLPAALASLSIFAVINTESLVHRYSRGPQNPDSRVLRVVRLETVFASAPEDKGTRSEQTMSAKGRTSPAADVVIEASRPSFDERFAGAFYVPRSRQTPEKEERSNDIALGSPDLGGQSVARHDPDQSVRGAEAFPRSPPDHVSKRPLRIGEALEDAISPSDADGRAAIYDIAGHTVYLPNGQRLEAHSGLGTRIDDPHYVSDRNRGPTPPHVYDLTLREARFHGVRAVRLIPVGGGSMFGRDGILAHSYMLGPNGQSNGCVAFRDYPQFLNAVLSGEINRLVVVERLAAKPSPQAALERMPETVKARFGS
jgi:hypothetical protein